MKSYVDLFIKCFVLAFGLGHLLADAINLVSPGFDRSRSDHYFAAISFSVFALLVKYLYDRSAARQAARAVTATGESCNSTVRYPNEWNPKENTEKVWLWRWVLLILLFVLGFIFTQF